MNALKTGAQLGTGTVLFPLLFLCLAAAGTGCQMLSDSSASSVSVSSISASLGSSSAAMTGYGANVTSMTVAFVESGATGNHFLRDLGRVAHEHGISDWEAEPDTYLAIGIGLRRGGLDEAGAHAFGHRFFGDDPRASELLLQGYRS